jgi:hypothetical protein
MKKNKIQAMLVEHLMKYGSIEILLPDSVKVEIGLTQENQNGKLIVKENYCWVIASRENRSTSLDAYNMGLRFSDDDKMIVLDDNFIDQNGENVRRLDVV